MNFYKNGLVSAINWPKRRWGKGRAKAEQDSGEAGSPSAPRRAHRTSNSAVNTSRDSRTSSTPRPPLATVTCALEDDPLWPWIFRIPFIGRCQRKPTIPSGTVYETMSSLLSLQTGGRDRGVVLVLAVLVQSGSMSSTFFGKRLSRPARNPGEALALLHAFDGASLFKLLILASTA